MVKSAHLMIAWLVCLAGYLGWQYMQHQSLRDESGHDAALLPLTIVSTPSDARIRILNIGPSYRAGMLLQAGRYNIEVSAEGFRRKTVWLEHPGPGLFQHIHLSRTGE